MTRRASVATAGALVMLLTACGANPGVAAADRAQIAGLPPLTAYVSDYYTGSVTPVRLATGRILKAIKVGSYPAALAISPNGATVFVINARSVSLIRTATNRAFRKIPVPGDPGYSATPVAFTPDSKIGYVSSATWNGTVTPIQTATGRVLPRIHVGHDPQAIAIAPDGKTAYVANYGSGTVTPFRVATGTPLRPIKVGRNPGDIAITPDGGTAFVSNQGSGTVTPIRLATGTALKPIKVGDNPGDIVITPDGKTAYVSSRGTVTVIRIATRTAVKAIGVLSFSTTLVLSPDGRMAYVIDGLYGSLTPIRTATNRALRKIRIGLITGVAFTPDSKLAYISSIGGTLTPIQLATGKLGRPIALHQALEDVAIAP